MPSVPPSTQPRSSSVDEAVAVNCTAITVAISGMVAAWLAAGSTGLLALPLQHALTWSALAVAIVLSWPLQNGSMRSWAILAGCTVVGIVMTMASSPVINTLAVAVVLAGIAEIEYGLPRRTVSIITFSVVVLAFFRLGCEAIPTVWIAADAIGRGLSHIAGACSGAPLHVGATLGGLDFLVLMLAVYVGWLAATAPPRRNRAICGAVAILVGHFAYLVLLAYSEKLFRLLPEIPLTPYTDNNHVGHWTWMSGLRTLVPWNVPLAALAIQSLIAGWMFRWAAWLPVTGKESIAGVRSPRSDEKQELAGSALAIDMASQFGPALLAVLIPIVVVYGGGSPTLKEKNVVAYDDGKLDWRQPHYEKTDNGRYGMLPLFVESLGGRFTKTSDLSEQSLAEADVLVLIQSEKPWSKETLDQIWEYVRRGGSLLVAGDRGDAGKSRGNLNELLESTAIRARDDTAVACSAAWEYGVGATSHPATAGIADSRGRFDFGSGVSLETRWPARPVLVGRWGWSKSADSDTSATALPASGELVGDLVLAAEQAFGQGRAIVLADGAPLQNESLANSFGFVGRMLTYLADKPSSPQAGWRQVLGGLAVLLLIGLLAWNATSLHVALTVVVLAIALVSCTSSTERANRILPDGRLHKPNNLAYIDASHVEAYSSDVWAPQGIGGLLRTLMRQGYLPLMLPELARDRLERAGLLISIGPAREFSGADRSAVQAFLADGGTFVCMVGAEETSGLGGFLRDEFGIDIPKSPVTPGEEGVEPKPLGTGIRPFGQYSRQATFCGAWPLQCDAGSCETLVSWNDGKNDWPIVVSRTVQKGTVVVIGSTYFGVNENLEMPNRPVPENIRFWRWLLSKTVREQKPWDPPLDAREEPASDSN